MVDNWRLVHREQCIGRCCCPSRCLQLLTCVSFACVDVAGADMSYSENGVKKKNGGKNFTLSFAIEVSETCLLAVNVCTHWP